MLKGLARRLEGSFRGRQAYKFFIKDWVSLGDLQACSAVVGAMRFSRNLEPLEMECPKGRRILVLAPHPDDEILGPGGTLIKCAADGRSITVLYFTSGKPAEVAETEARSVAAYVGYQTKFLRFPLGAISLDDEALARSANAIREASPDCVFLPFLFDDHDDHRRVSELLRALVHRGMIAVDGVEVWGYQVYTALLPNVVVDITAVASRKAEAMRMFASQMRRRDWAHYVLGLNAFNSRFLKDSTAPKCAEAFFVVPAAEYVRLADVYFEVPERAYYSKPYTVAR
ncbi:MAG: hypothetical protein FJX57_15205 [Alphaproteobacteria bacterium]|nr:hypothetical protein [Alphaproteobacteria bacterium]